MFVSSRYCIDDFEGTVYSFTPGWAMRKGIDPHENYRLYSSGASAWDEE
jgi:hypothetical protein